MKRQILVLSTLLAALLCCAGLARAQIAVVDFPGSALPLKTATKLSLSEPITVSAGADALIVDVTTYASETWSDCAFAVNGTLLTQATSYVPASGVKVGTAVYYEMNPPTGTLTLTGTFGTAQGATVDWLTLDDVNTAITPIAASVNGGSLSVATISLSGATDGAFAICTQAVSEAGGNHATMGYYAGSTGIPYTLTWATVAGDVGGSDGYVQQLATAPTTTLSASVDFNPGANHPFSTAIFTALSTSGTASWIAGNGNWSNGANWSTSAAPFGAGATALMILGTSSRTVTLDQPETIGNLHFSIQAPSQTAGYTITGTNGLTFDNSGSGALVTTDQGTHTIAAPVTLADNISFTPAYEATIDISGDIGESPAGQALTMPDTPAGQVNPWGTLILSGSNTYSGGTFVDSGVLEVMTSNSLLYGSALTVADNGVVEFGDPSAIADVRAHSAATAVPEPATSLLLAAAGILLLLKRERG